MLLEDDRRRRGVEVCGPGSNRVGRRVALVDLVHRQAEARVQLAAEAARPLGVDVRRAVGVARHADDERRRPPFGDQRSDCGHACLALDGDGHQRRCRARQRVAGGDADAAGAEIESEEGERLRGHCERAAHACPASELSMLASMPSSDSALP